MGCFEASEDRAEKAKAEAPPECCRSQSHHRGHEKAMGGNPSGESKELTEANQTAAR
jgi:hypothetical protein